MRYWLFDGNDVIGPLTPQCIAQRVGFSPSFLVCPEQESENEGAWQPASSFEDFKINADSVVSDKQPVKNSFRVSSSRQATPAAIPPSNTSNAHAVRRIQPVLTLSNEQPIPDRIISNRTFSHKEPLAFSAIPISQVEKDEVILPLHSSYPEAVSPIKTQASTGVKTKASTPRAQQAVSTISKQESPRKTSEPSLSLRPLHSLPILGVSESRLPLVPEETDFHFTWNNPPQKKSSYATPSSIAAQRQEKRLKQWKVSSVALSAETGSLPLPNSVLAPLTGFSDTIEELVPTPRPVVVKQPAPRAEIPVQRTVAPVVKKTTVTPAAQQVRAAQDPEEELPTSLKKSSTRSTRNVLFGIFCIFLTLACLAAGYLFLPSFKWKGTPRAVAATTPRASVSSAIKTPSKTMQSIPTPPPPQTITEPLAQEEAVRIVKEHLLSNGRGTVETYLNRLYGTHLAQGYQANWSAEPLYKNTYIVKYRLAKTRTEPIIYVFQADTVTGQLTGALNNITLDLVGKV
ncbi:MAG: hypothetical protein J5601_01280 [Elusimicrobiaceae bacterium]|nr:hypothetical protein [Elusimicrobiaceae bacterium]